MKNLIYIIFAAIAVSFIGGCIDSQKVIKNPNREYKYSMAKKWFDEKKYVHAVPVIEDLLSAYKGTDTAPKLYFMLAESYYRNKEYIVGAYHFKTYKDLYGKTPAAEEATYKLADCYYKQIPPIELDQADAEKAIVHFRAFVAEYPSSDYVPKAMEAIEKLKRIKETKALMAADLYYKTKNYRAAAVTYKNILNEFPEVPGYEDIMYKIVVSNFKYAQQSILKKQPERYEAAINEGQSFLTRFSASTKSKEINELVERSYIELLKTSLKYAQSLFPLEDRPIHFQEAISAYRIYEKEIQNKPSFLSEYLDECYYGIMYSSYLIVDGSKEKDVQERHYRLFEENYFRYFEMFSEKSRWKNESIILKEKIKKSLNS